MRFVNSIFQTLLKAIDRRAFAGAVARHDGDAYDKRFNSWDHLVTLVFAQLSSASSLRAVEARWNAGAHHHYHLGTGKLARSTLADANARRPPELFAETFALLSKLAERTLRRDGAEMIRLIDSTPIPLDEMCAWARWNGRTRGLKMHVVHDPNADHPRRIEITHANVNDVEIGRKTAIEAGATYVFDKAYCAYDWWAEIHAAKGFFVTRPKTNARFVTLAPRPLGEIKGEDFEILEDCDVRLASKGDSKLDMPLRLVRVRRANGKDIVILSNDVASSALDIALLYKTRWEIELLFRWL